MTWQRLEGTTVGVELTEGQEARVADPLWLLGRQWQVGELTAEDAASPALIEATVEHTAITRLRVGPGPTGPTQARDHGGAPLEALVERENVHDGPASARIAAEASLQLWRVLGVAGAAPSVAAALRAAYPLTLPADNLIDPVGRAELELLARRAVAADALAAAVNEAAGGQVAGLPAGTPAAVAHALRAWAGWYAGLFSEPPAGRSAWDPARMEYAFSIGAGIGPELEVQLTAPEYAGGSLDWYSFELSAGGLPMGAAGTLTSRTLQVVPTPARFAGQAASRWWQVENREVWFGDLTAAPEDLARAAVAGYGLLFGDDWFVVPCRLPSGVLARGRGAAVLDTFSEAHAIRSCAELDGPNRVWRFFELTSGGSSGTPAAALAALAPEPEESASPWLFLPRVLAGRTESKPLEEVAFLRDEAANLAWAAEALVESAAGRTVDRAALARRELTPLPGPTGDAWRYRLATQVPDNLVPLMPTLDQAAALTLRRGLLTSDGAGGEVTTRGALGIILEPWHPLSLFDATIPPTGVTVTRSWQMARDAGGGVALWVGRRQRSGRPRRAPGLGFDEILTG